MEDDHYHSDHVHDQDHDTDMSHSIDIVDGDLKCAICQDYFIEPVCTSCGHHFCRGCLLRWIGGDHRPVPTCPECRQLFPFGFDKNFLRVTKPDIFLTKILRQKVYISCPHNCGARLHPASIAAHEVDCPAAIVACDNHALGCPRLVCRRDLKTHLLECPATPCPAAALGCSYAGIPDSMETHSMACTLCLVKAYVDSVSGNIQTLAPNDGMSSARRNAAALPVFVPGGRLRTFANLNTTTADPVTTYAPTTRRLPSGSSRAPGDTLHVVRAVTDRDTGETTDHSFINVSFRQLNNLEQFATSLSNIVMDQATGQSD